jgi:hypothetical protein
MSDPQTANPCVDCTKDCETCPLNEELMSLFESSGLPPEQPSPPALPPPEKENALTPVEPQRKPGRPKKDPSQIQKRSRGAQPGNLNALRHGLYVQGNAIFNTTPMERARMVDLAGAIDQLRNYLDNLYQNGMKLKNISEINATTHALSAGYFTLTRLITLHDLSRATMLPSALYHDNRSTTPVEIENYYRNKVHYLDQPPALPPAAAQPDPLNPSGEE